MLLMTSINILNIHVVVSSRRLLYIWSSKRIPEDLLVDLTKNEDQEQAFMKVTTAKEFTSRSWCGLERKVT